jgi:hypothetical protein
MKLVEQHVDSFTVAGVDEARTTNAREASGKGVIGRFGAALKSLPANRSSRSIAITRVTGTVSTRMCWARKGTGHAA